MLREVQVEVELAMGLKWRGGRAAQSADTCECRVGSYRWRSPVVPPRPDEESSRVDPPTHLA